MSFLLYLVYCVLLIRNQQFCERGDSGYVPVTNDDISININWLGTF